MSYVIQVVLSNARHPEYGQFTIPFPIPQDAYRNVERYLNGLPELNIAPAQEAGIEQTGPVL